MAEPVETTVVFGTAGHIDHGKTTLVKALSGVDCDRLVEEKKRGITIELGFAPLSLPSGRIISIIDVPGHERFIRQMVAGAAGIDAVIFVVAADEGVMPQSREHLEILSLLGIKEGLVVLTKADMVDEEMLELAREDVKDLVRGTFLEGKPIIAVSAVTGLNLDILLKQIDAILENISPRDTKGPFFMPIDRSFPIAGFGTVVTGTVYKGKVSVGDAVDVLPLDKSSKVRSIQVHGKPVKQALAGQRSALNLPDVRSAELKRGDVACSKGLFKSTQCLDVRLMLLSSAQEPLRHWQEVHFHMGTSESMARVALLNDARITPGNEALAQVVLYEPVVALIGQRFVIRAYTPLRTIGGGEVLFPYDKKPKGKKARNELTVFLNKLTQAQSFDERIKAIIDRFGLLSLEDALTLIQQTSGQLESSLRLMAERSEVLLVESGDQPLVMSSAYFDTLKEDLYNILTKYHDENPHMSGMKALDLISALGLSLTKKQSQELMRLLASRGLIEIDGEMVRLPGASPKVSEDTLRDKEILLDYCNKRGFQFPTIEEAMSELKLDKVKLDRIINIARQNGELRLIGGEFLLSRNIEEKALEILRSLPEITIASLRDAANASRKYILPLLEDFDARGITRRVGDKRILLKKK
ncbi:selenocysteine-specific elongation factor SelB [Acetomicrobium mobile DSM 13181]|uniref:Selenocysteine-specific elongation factor n=1 Tax=Acetomicrobium mobile (strain ATCC BAA-54 / DSM 13181 / JCM 12221 / NGA) TaxID=891968 RepID=I4BWH4_ACEMN|nr:selenocysteine-specific translation elongation factor [Acetomicrobium mobile]AFM21631.1 selenocysteine-specific elongation factor SelB [Acetomicrobium mobile DSM 13181]